MIISYIALALAILVFSGCGMTGTYDRELTPSKKILAYENIQPAWASADGKGPEHVYMYYPSKGIYYDTGRGIYFYNTNGGWMASDSIPARLSPNIGSYVAIVIDTDKPYEYHAEVQKKYPAY